MSKMTSLVKKIVTKTENLKQKRSCFEQMWQEISELVLPRKSAFAVKQTAGSSRTRKLFETTAINSAEFLAAGLFGMMTNPSGKWFFLKSNEKNQNADQQKKISKWIDAVQNIMMEEINRPLAGFSTNMHEVYLDLAVLGTAGMYVGWNEEKNCLLFQSRFLGELYIDENLVGQVDTVHRIFPMTLEKIVQTWGKEAIPEILKNKYAQDPQNDQEFDIIHALFPNPFFDKKSLKQKPISSVYVLKDFSWMVFESGFEEMPLFVVRWSKATSEVYGRSPASSALPDIKMIQEMMKETIISAQLANRPPLMVRDDDQFAPMATIPGGVIRYSSEPPKPFVSGANSGVGLAMMNEIRDRIRKAFFNDYLISSGDIQMTATEVIQRNEEKMRLLGPISGRIQTELLGPMINRVFGLLLRNGKIPNPRDLGIEKVDFSVEYMSPLTLAQKQIEAQALVSTLDLASGFLQIDPDAKDILNVPEIVRKIAGIYAISSKSLRSDREIGEFRESKTTEM